MPGGSSAFPGRVDVKACVLHAVGDLRYEDVKRPVAHEGEVVLAVRACGVCGSDVPRVFSKGAYHFPIIPGHEFAGEVVEAGPGADPALVEQRAAVFPLIPCRRCGPCAIGAYAQCENYDYLGSRCDGAFAEYVRVPSWNLIPIPEGVSFEAAAMTEPAAVAAHALRRASVDLGDTVAIFGAGPIGLLAAMWARIWGAGTILLLDIDEKKLDFAKKLGFSHGFDPKKDDVSRGIRGIAPHGADIVVEASGSSAAYEQCMAAARHFGKVVLMGNPAGPMTLSQQAYGAILRRELTVLGTWNSVFNDSPRNEWRLALDAMAAGRLNPEPLITHRVGLDGVYDALVMMRDRTAFSNKVICVMPAGIRP